MPVRTNAETMTPKPKHDPQGGDAVADLHGEEGLGERHEEDEAEIDDEHHNGEGPGEPRPLADKLLKPRASKNSVVVV